MRGPGVRIQYDVRRLWRCPECGAERRVAASQTTVTCECRRERPLMHLIEPQRRVRPTPPPLDLVMTEADCDPEIAPSPEVASVDVTAERLPEIVLDSETANSLSDLEAEDGV